jgi:hypothetical protein
MIRHIHKTVAVLAYPVTAVVEAVHGDKLKHAVKSKRTTKVFIGVGITLVGSTMATNPVSFVPHVIWDALAYTLHGYGALPVIKILCERLNLESIDEGLNEQRRNKKQPKDNYDI